MAAPIMICVRSMSRRRSDRNFISMRIQMNYSMW